MAKKRPPNARPDCGPYLSGEVLSLTTMRLPKPLLDTLREHAEQQYVSRNKLIEFILRNYVNEPQRFVSKLQREMADDATPDLFA